jgi:uncharacterized protein (DUF1778 family)
MAVSRNILESNKKHLNKLDRIVFYVPKGEKDTIKEAAARAGTTPNQYIVQAIKEKMEKESS